MAKLGNQPSVPNINALAYKYKPKKATRLGLSGDSDTSPLDLTTTGVLVHTATNYAYDEVFLWCCNYHNSTHTLTLEIGGDGSFSDDSKTIVIELAGKGGLVQVYPGIPHREVSIYAKCNQDDRMNIFGYVDRHYRTDLTDETLGYDTGTG
tara:strand:- start:1152 stop:1604 length:453 start_codon:yes stop_codon:yes gene_type:complete